MRTAVVTFTLNLPVTFEQEGEWVIASFPTIDVVSQGRDREEAERNLVEAAQLFIESCFERNALDEVLKACGFSVSRQARAAEPADKDHLTVPIELLAARNGPPAHAC